MIMAGDVTDEKHVKELFGSTVDIFGGLPFFWWGGKLEADEGAWYIHTGRLDMLFNVRSYYPSDVTCFK
jgi:hypothetical protein